MNDIMPINANMLQTVLIQEGDDVYCFLEGKKWLVGGTTFDMLEKTKLQAMRQPLDKFNKKGGYVCKVYTRQKLGIFVPAYEISEE